MQPGIRTAVLAACVGASSMATAGQVEVVFVDPASYTDIGSASWDDNANMRELDRYLRWLGQRWLAADQSLKVEVLEVDLAGAMRPGPTGQPELRILAGDADFPRMRLRYTLSGTGVQRSGDERLADLNYTRGLANRGDSQALFYEKRMLYAWFKARFVAGRPD